jgi:hypothetical protein
MQQYTVIVAWYVSFSDGSLCVRGQIPNAPIIPTSQLDDHIAHINALMDQEARQLHAMGMDINDPSQYQFHSHLSSSIMGAVQVHQVSSAFHTVSRNSFLCGCYAVQGPCRYIR